MFATCAVSTLSEIKSTCVLLFFLDTMDNWDEKKLEEVVNKKHGEAETKKTKTHIVRIPC